MTILNWLREGLGLIYALILSALFYFSPLWDPLSAASGRQASLMMCGLLLLNLLYLLSQAWPLVLGKVGTAFGLMTDFAFSALPIVPALLAVAFHLGGFSELSFSNLVICGVTFGIIAFDIVVFGGIGSLVNRLTTDFYQGRGTKE